MHRLPVFWSSSSQTTSWLEVLDAIYELGLAVLGNPSGITRSHFFESHHPD